MRIAALFDIHGNLPAHAAHNVLVPPSEAQMLEALGRAELRYAPPPGG